MARSLALVLIAVASFAVARADDGDDADDFISRGTLWAAKKEYDKAIEDFTEAIRLSMRPARKPSSAMARRQCR